MKFRHVLSVPAIAVATVAAAASPAAADRPEVFSGYFIVNSVHFPTTPATVTGSVERFSFSITATSYGDLLGTFTEHLDCARVHDVVRCQGHAISKGADGSTGEIRTHITCNSDLSSCSGHSKGRGTTADGRPLVWHTIVSPGPGVGLYETRLVKG